MIKNNSVRVDNLVLYNGEIYSINQITKEEFVLIYDFRINKHLLVSWSDIKGIPVTEEIIRTLGWNNDKEKDVTMPFIIGHGLTDKKFYAVLGEYYILLSFVHELQNVYYMVDETEIDISKLVK